MTLTLQEISDRIEINNLLIDYCTAVDAKNFAEFDNIFTADAYIDYTCFGGPKGGLTDIKAFLTQSMKQFPNTQHMIANCRIWLDGDTAKARTICHNPMETPIGDGKFQIAYFGLWYVDKLIRTENGWRIKERVEEKSYIFNFPRNFQQAQKQ